MKQILSEIEVNGVTYVPKGTEDANRQAPSVDGLPLVIIRATSSGVHYGYLKRREKDEVELVNARRIYYWTGAASLSQLALEGTSKPSTCKFAVALPAITVMGVIEIIPVSLAAKAVIDAVKEWRA